MPNQQGDVEGKGIVRPPWLGFAVHVLNSLVAWSDLAVSHQVIPTCVCEQQDGACPPNASRGPSHA